MSYQLTQNRTNNNFTKALAWVQKTYPHLFTHELQSIELVDPDKMPHAFGTHERTGPESSRIRIRNGQYEVIEFIDTLVHEFVHLFQYQYTSESLTHADKYGREIKAIEREADSIAYLAVKRYRQENDVPLWK